MIFDSFGLPDICKVADIVPFDNDSIGHNKNAYFNMTYGSYYTKVSCYSLVNFNLHLCYRGGDNASGYS